MKNKTIFALADDLVETTKDAKHIMNADGTVRGIVFCNPSGSRGALLQVAINRNKPNGLLRSVVVDGRDFRTIYSEAIDLVAKYHNVSKGSVLFKLLQESLVAFLSKYKLGLIEVRYEQVKPLVEEEQPE